MMDSVHWGSNFNSPFHGINFNRTLLKNSSFHDLTNSSTFDSSAKSLDGNLFSALSSAVLAASTTLVSAPTISPFFHSVPALSIARSISAEYTATPAVMADSLELESPDSESRSLCLSPDEQEQQDGDGDRDHSTQEMAELDLPPAGHSPRSDAESDEWSVPATNNENDSTQGPTIVKNSSLMDIAEAVRASETRKEEFSDSDNEEEQQADDELDEKEKEEEEDAHVEVEAEDADEEQNESEVEEKPRKCRSKAKSKARSRQPARHLVKPSRRSSSGFASGRRAPISSAARLASQKKYDEKRRGIYRRLYGDLKDAIRAAQLVAGAKKEDGAQAEMKKGKKKKKKKDKEIEDLSTRELLMLASNTIEQLQNQKSQLDKEWGHVKRASDGKHTERNIGDSSMKQETFLDRKRKRGSGRTDTPSKHAKRQHTTDVKIESQQAMQPQRAHPAPVATFPSHLSLSSIVNSDLFTAQSFPSPQFSPSPSISASSALWSSSSSTSSSPLHVKAESVSPSPTHSASQSPSSSPLLLLGSAPAAIAADDAKRMSMFRILFLHLRSVLLSSTALLSVLHRTPIANMWRCTLLSLLNSDWSEQQVAAMSVEQLFVTAAQIITALQWLQQQVPDATQGTAGNSNEHEQVSATMKTESAAAGHMDDENDEEEDDNNEEDDDDDEDEDDDD